MNYGLSPDVGSSEILAPWKDGWTGTAPVGSYFPNPFGLHDTTGNVWEWCLDETHSYQFDRWSGTGQSVGGNVNFRSIRGGAYNESAQNLRSAIRENLGVDLHSQYVGVRPVVRLRVAEAGD